MPPPYNSLQSPFAKLLNQLLLAIPTAGCMLLESVSAPHSH